jgi:phosphatidylcholine synthase
MEPQPYPLSPATRAPHPAFAWAVHAYTATGALAAFAAVLAVFDDRYRTAFALLVLATVIDATDGVLARLARVKDVTPHFDGARLDDIVDYLTFVFVPMLLLYRVGELPARWAAVPVAAVLLSSAYGFCATDAKTDDGFFTGFPSYWNIVAVYLYAARLAPIVSASILLLLSVLVFVRNGYVYPTRTPVLRGLTIALGAVWGAMMLTMIAWMPDVPRALVIVSLFFPVYYAVLSFMLDARRGLRS